MTSCAGTAPWSNISVSSAGISYTARRTRGKETTILEPAAATVYGRTYGMISRPDFGFRKLWNSTQQPKLIYQFTTWKESQAPLVGFHHFWCTAFLWCWGSLTLKKKCPSERNKDFAF